MGINHYALISCTSGLPLAERISSLLTLDPCYRGILNSEEVIHPDGEIESRIYEYVRGNDIYVVQQLISPLTWMSVNDNLVALCLTIQAARRAQASSVTAVIPYYAYSRQDRRNAKEEGVRKSIGAQLMAQFLLASGASGLMNIDVHNESIEAFFPNDFAFDNIYPTNLMIDYLNDRFGTYLDDAVIASLDLGGTKRSNIYAERMGLESVFINKRRNPLTGEIDQVELSGSVDGRYVIAIDDIGGTIGTFKEGSKTFIQHNAKAIIAGFSIPIFSSHAWEHLQELYDHGYLLGAFGTNAVWHGPKEKIPEWFGYVDISDRMATAIRTIQEKGSLNKALD